MFREVIPPEHLFRIGVSYSTPLRKWMVTAPRLKLIHKKRRSCFDTIQDAMWEQNERYKIKGTTYLKHHGQLIKAFTMHNKSRPDSLWHRHSEILEKEFEIFLDNVSHVCKSLPMSDMKRKFPDVFREFLEHRMFDPKSNRH